MQGNTDEQQRENLIGSFHTIIDEGCERIRNDLETIQTANKTLMIEHNRLLAERNNLDKRVYASYEKSFLLFVEMSRYREISNRLETIIAKIAPYLPSEHQDELSSSIYRAKQFTNDDLKLFTNQLSVEALPRVPNDIQVQVNQNTEQKPTGLNNIQTSLTNLWNLLLDAATNGISGLPNMMEMVQDQKRVTDKSPSIVPCKDVKRPPVKRKRPIRGKDLPLTAKKQPNMQQPKSKAIVDSSSMQSLVLASENLSQCDIKPSLSEIQENSQSQSQSQRVLTQKSIHDYYRADR